MKAADNLRWIPSAYFMQGMPYAVIAVLSIIFLRSFHLSNARVAFYSSLLLVPWAIKPLWVSWLERFSHYRRAVLACQLLEICFLGLLIIGIKFSWVYCFLLLGCLAFVAATYDIFTDGLYLHHLTLREQSLYIGLRTFSYQLARISVQGGLIALVGLLLLHFKTATAWQIIFVLLLLITFLLLIYHKCFLPNCIKNTETTSSRPTPFKIFKEFFAIPSMLLFLLFTLVFNFPEAQLQRILPLFLLDQHGLNLSTYQLGIAYGFCGTGAMIFGVIVAGWMAAKYGVKRLLLKFLLLTVLSNVAYLYLAIIPIEHKLLLTILIVSVAQFTFGLSNSAYMITLMKKVEHYENRMSFYAYLTAVMALSFAGFSAFSGVLQTWLGYQGFFLWIAVAGVLVLILVWQVMKNDRTL